jgi:signal transduction histidine kinase
MFVASSRLVKEGSTIDFSVDLGERKVSVTGRGVVRWVRPKEINPFAPKGIGIQVLAFDQETHEPYHEYLEQALLRINITDVMTKQVPVVTQDDTIVKASFLMTQYNEMTVIALDSDRNVMGMMTDSDIVALVGHYNLETTRVFDVMNRDITIMDAGDTAGDGFRTMRASDQSSFPVVENQKFVGLVSSRNLVPLWTEIIELQGKKISNEYEVAVGMVSHDLRSPLAFIKTACLMVQGGDISVEEFKKSEFISLMVQNCDQMMRLIDDLLDISAINTNRFSLNYLLTDLGTLLDQVMMQFQEQAQQKSMEFEVFRFPELPPIAVDPLRMKQVIENLISNAVKYAPAGTKISVSLQLEGDWLKLSVKDQGPGIPKHELPLLFKMFPRTSQKPTGGEKSTGLGLVITKRLVELHKGRMKVDSQLGVGSNFQVFLPIGNTSKP